MAEETRRERWIRLVGTMLAAATNPTTPPGEAELMMNRALEIMARYEIDEALARAVHTGADDPIVQDEYVFHLAYARAYAVKLSNLAEVMGCRCVLENMRNGDYRLHMFGRRSVIDRLLFLFPSLATQCVNEMMAECRRLGRQGDRAFKRSFVIGYCHRLVVRMNDLMQRQRKDLDTEQASQYALVLVSDADLSLKLRDEAFPRTFQMRTNSSNSHGFLTGKIAANRADLGQSRVGSNRLAIGG